MSAVTVVHGDQGTYAKVGDFHAEVIEGFSHDHTIYLYDDGKAIMALCASRAQELETALHEALKLTRTDRKK